MATQPMGEANQQLWDETLSKLLNLSSSTVRRNNDLENRVAELEVELLVWKQAHSVALEASEREVKAHNVQIAALNRQISNLDCFKSNQNPLILCIINGDELVFNCELLGQGYQGGHLAAQHLTKGIAEHLSNEEAHVYGKLSFWITIYFNKAELAENLTANNMCSHEEFQAFWAGFSHASPRFSAVDAGASKEVLEGKIKEYLQTFTRFPQTLRVFFGGYDPMAYMSTFNGLDKDQMLGKIVLLYSSQDSESKSDKSALYSLPRLLIDGLFLSEKPPHIPKKLTPLTTGLFSAVTSNGGLISPQSPARTLGRSIDPSLVTRLASPQTLAIFYANPPSMSDCYVALENPPPCNEHYLMTCSKGPSLCKYSHDYVLTPEQLTSLANNAKKAPCNWLKNGVQCPYGDQCCWGHVCPNGPKCFHLSKGKCWFKGEGMHPEA